MRKYLNERERAEGKRARDRASAKRRRDAKRAARLAGVPYTPPSHSIPITTSPVKGTVNVALVLDASGSMFTLRNTAMEQINRQIRNLAAQARATGQQTYVSLYLFNNQGNLRTISRGQAPEYVRELTAASYYPTGQTALLDAIQDVTADLHNADDGGRYTSFLVLVVTDGQENDSRTSRFTIQELIRQKQGTDRWTFALSVPRGGRYYAEQLGVPKGNIQEWETTDLGLERLSQNIMAASTSYYAGTRRGATHTKSFFTDLSKIGTTDLRKLDDLTGNFRHWKVENEADIRPFVESKGVSYQVGRAYYQLTKAEKVQNHKDFVIREKTSKRLFGGDQARNLVGISRTAGAEVRVHPGNHANYDLFVQSTSTNRKLVRGTTLLYRVS
jgi:hypothetical protein